MRHLIQVWVEGDPRPYSGTQPRNRGGRYVPQEIRDWQEKVAIAVKNAMQLASIEPSAGRIRLELMFYLPDYHTRDLDNLEKSTIDAIKGHAFKDDNQVVQKESEKRFTLEHPDVQPGARITVIELTPTHQTRQDYNAKRRKAKP